MHFYITYQLQSKEKKLQIRTKSIQFGDKIKMRNSQYSDQ